MKQSTKLLSLVLALVMAFGCMSVIGNAALVKSEVKWDNIDDAKLTAEQVADLALDLVDNDLLADMEAIDLSILGVPCFVFRGQASHKSYIHRYKTFWKHKHHPSHILLPNLL